MSERESAQDCADHREGREVRSSVRAEALLLLQIGGIHILRAVRDKIHHGHQHDKICKSWPIAEDGAAIGLPVGARSFPCFGLGHLRANEKCEQRRQSAYKKERSPAPMRKNKTISARC